ncbi:MAG TPA: TetR/AcrR family transcriptional regulator [Fimbriimonadaceae bacterium]|nr:TetR/AcrR family transcriptional regulator [Fimbriimonadaceae bacterium]
MNHPAKERKQLDPAKTRASILRAAFKQFSEKGYKGASIGDIATAAKVRKSLIQYHFGNKEQLWNACLETKVAPVIDAIDRLLESGSGDPREIVLMRYKLIRDNPEVRRLIAWASLSGVPAPKFVVERRDRLIGSLSAETNDPRFVRLLFALSASDGWLHFRNLYRTVAGEAVMSEEVEQGFLRILQEVASKDE